MIDISIDNEGRLLRAVIFNDKEGSYSNWNFHKEDFCFITQLVFVLKTVMTRVRKYTEEALFFNDPVRAEEHRSKVKPLILTLQSLEAPDYYDYYNEEVYSDKCRFYTNKPFQENQSPCNDLGYFARSIATQVDNLINMEIRTRRQVIAYLQKYDECAASVIRSCEDMWVFDFLYEELFENQNLTMREIMNHIRWNAFTVAEKYFNPFPPHGVEFI